MNKEIKTYRLIIKGKVQNVGFRHWFSNLAISLGLNGYVQNTANNDEVEAIVQGNINAILIICPLQFFSAMLLNAPPQSGLYLL